jgi:hypothetical protein
MEGGRSTIINPSIPALKLCGGNTIGFSNAITHNVIGHRARHDTERDSLQPLKPCNHQITIRSRFPSNMASKQTDSTVKLEDRILLAVNAYQNGQFKSI